MPDGFIFQFIRNKPILIMEEQDKNNPTNVWPVKLNLFLVIQQIRK